MTSRIHKRLKWGGTARNISRTYAGLLTIPLGTAFALLVAPNNPSEPGRLTLAAWIFCAGLLAAIGIDVFTGGIERIFRAEHVLLISIVIVLYAELLQPGYYTELNPDIVQKVFLASGVFATSVALGSALRPPKLPRSVIALAGRRYSARLLFRVAISCWLLAMLNFASASGFSPGTMVEGLFSGRFSAPWSRGQFGGWEAFRDFLTYFGHLVPVFTVLLALKTKSWASYRVLVCAASSVVFLTFLAQGGGRRIFVDIIGSCLITWILAKRKQLLPEHYLAIVGVVFATALLTEIMLQVRTVGLAALFDPESRTTVTSLHVDDNFYALGQTLRILPSEAAFVGFPYIWYIVVRPVPRALWPGKPMSPGFDLAIHLGLKGVGLSNTGIGDLYTSYGWAGIILGGFFLGWLARFWSQLIDHDHGLTGTALYAVGAMALFMGFRGLIELFLMSYPVLCWLAIDRVFSRPKRERLVPSRHRVFAYETR